MPLDEECRAGARHAGCETRPRRLRRLTAGLAAPGPGFWALVGGLIGLDALWLAAAGMSVARPGLLAVLGTMAVLLALSPSPRSAASSPSPRSTPASRS